MVREITRERKELVPARREIRAPGEKKKREGKKIQLNISFSLVKKGSLKSLFQRRVGKEG